MKEEMKERVRNKYFLQMIGGVLLFFSFFLTWITVDNEATMPANRLFTGFRDLLMTLLPVFGITCVYFGYIKKFSFHFLLIPVLIGSYILLKVNSLALEYSKHDFGSKYLGPEYYDYSPSSGFYLCLFGVLCLIGSLVVSKLEDKQRQIQERHSA